jgi:hypothetical protein
MEWMKLWPTSSISTASSIYESCMPLFGQWGSSSVGIKYELHSPSYGHGVWITSTEFQLMAFSVNTSQWWIKLLPRIQVEKMSRCFILLICKKTVKHIMLKLVKWRNNCSENMVNLNIKKIIVYWPSVMPKLVTVKVFLNTVLFHRTHILIN